MLHRSKLLVYRKVAELKAPAEIQRAHNAHYGSVVLAVIKSLYHKAKGPGSQRDGGGEVERWRGGGNINKQRYVLKFICVLFCFCIFPPPRPVQCPVQGL